MNDLHLQPRLAPSEIRFIDQTCDRFETAWRSGTRPRVEDYVCNEEPVRSHLLRQLLLIDSDYLRQSGEQHVESDYRSRFPSDMVLIDEISLELSRATESTWDGAAVGEESPTPTALQSSRIGRNRYQVITEVGHGGIGVVYRSRDTILGRDVAVKVLREEYCQRPEARRRFFDEAHVCGQMQHPAIVPVYEQGSLDDDRPYFTMKLVEGQTLSQLLHDRTVLELDLPRLLKIYEQVCQAMSYSHAQSVIHRDLKPSNIMVGAFGEVQVMDWGFSKRLQPEDGSLPMVVSASIRHPNHSESGILMGTPAYMPPEQARGEVSLVDRRTDVFALGAILCEILTGTPPYAGDNGDEVCRQAIAGNVKDAFTRLESSRADAALCLLARRCLAPERDDRPADAGAIVRDLASYFASTQLRLQQSQSDQAAAEARAEEAIAKATVERHARRLLLGLAAALLVGTGVATWMAVVANRAKQDAISAEAEQKKAKVIADEKEKETRAVLGFVQDRVIAAARPKGLNGGLGYDVKLRDALTAALPMVEKSFTDQPLVEARVRMTLGDSFDSLGEWRTALEQQLRARTLLTQHLGADDEQTIASINALAKTYKELGDHHEALRMREEILTLLRARVGDDHPRTLSAMVNVAGSYFRFGRYEDSVRLLQQALPLLIAKKGEDDDVTLAAMNNLAASHAGLHQSDEALKLYERVLALRRNKPSIGPDHPHTILSMNNLANCYVDLGRHDEALKLREDALEKRLATLSDNHPDTWRSMQNLATSFNHFERHAEALELREKVLAKRVERHGCDHPDTLWAMWDVAGSLIKLNRAEDSLKMVDECIQRARKQVVDPDLLPCCCCIRARCHEKLGNVAECRASAEMCERLPLTDRDALFEAACCRAITARALRGIDTTQADAEADRAMMWLNKAVSAGYHNFAKLQKVSDLDAIRDRADFKKLVATLQASQK